MLLPSLADAVHTCVCLDSHGSQIYDQSTENALRRHGQRSSHGSGPGQTEGLLPVPSTDLERLFTDHRPLKGSRAIIQSLLIPQRAMEQAKRRPADPAYFRKEGGKWRPTTWETYASQIRRAGKAMIALGVEPGGTVCVLGFTCPEWAIFDIGCMAAGGVPAGIYTTNAPEECEYILNHAEAILLLVENEEQWQKIRRIRGNLPYLKHIITMKHAPRIDDPQVMNWDAFLAKGEGIEDSELDARMAALEPDQLAKLIYTSGTTGPPKGVMLSHGNLAWVGNGLVELSDWHAGDRTISFLPLSHIAEQNMSIHGALTAGSPVYYAESFQKLADNIKEVQPTLFLAVPRIWEKFYAALRSNLAQVGGLKKGVLGWAMRVAGKVTKGRMGGREPTGILAIEYALARRLVLDKIKSAIGLGRVRMCISGAAPIAREILEFMAGLDILINEVYGLSEATGGISFNRMGKVRFGSVGTSLPDVEVRLADDGEILAKGPNRFLGYYKDEAATAETVVDGWLRSGDIGRLDSDGYLYIVDRKKHIIITAGGKNITPANIEYAIQARDSIISHVHAHGDRRPYVSALVTLDPVKAIDFGLQHGLVESPEKAETLKSALRNDPGAGDSEVHALLKAVANSPELRQRLVKAVREANAKLSRVEQVKRIYLLDRELSIEEGEITPTMKVKRRKVEKKFAPIFDRLYEDESFGIVIMEK